MKKFIFNYSHPDTEIISTATQLLKTDHVGIIPTDTVYGLAGRLTNIDVEKRIYDIKQRDTNKIFVLQTSNIKRAIELLDNIDEKIEKFLCNFWPGALTVIGNSSKYLKEQYNWNYETVALRIPDNPFDLAVFEKIDEPIMVTSVNISGHELPENIESMLELFSGKIDFAVIDENEYKVIPSTIIDITKGFPKIIRQGIIEDKVILNKWEL